MYKYILKSIGYASSIFTALFMFRSSKPYVTIYGGAKLKPSHPYYKLGVELGEGLSKANINVMTGGGPGIMEAVNKGAQCNGGKSYGCCINFSMEAQSQNKHLDIKYATSHFFVRKMVFTENARGFIAMPGGFGTMDELFEMATLITTRKMRKMPIILIGSAFWNPIIKTLEKQLLQNGLINQKELDVLMVLDDIDEIVKIMKKSVNNA